jgi:hypothetical protein
MPLHINRAALAGRQRDELFQKLIGGLVEGDAAAANFAAANLALQFKIPVLGKILGLLPLCWCGDCGLSGRSRTARNGSFPVCKHGVGLPSVHDWQTYAFAYALFG